ncbi:MULTISPECIES: hypothetical protein [Ralstonia solanacearum species complex]|uniref:hypothetical protein n=1 Tax=Ralstonia solanacearum species complex TaxID=3116862 RepID=UPI0004D7D70C|nr:hypothetical protein [Ralstonia solanacearum]ATJ86496.1 hypothetical protein CDC59_09640 [Ralstonia solanacearum]KEI32227.1 hypothetical protein CQ06_17905 [Ralstonia solanacearum]KFZ95026.1 hypothetical protein CR47_0205650 [Ralstonia solanacearum]MDN4064554.1 hypothetical protein [Ralstonia solanacearum]NUU72085.1 hypothetical protein [Ralstonia solanacearum]
MLTKEPISPSDEKNKDKQGKAARHMLGFKRQVASGKWQVASGKRQAVKPGGAWRQQGPRRA